MPRYSNSGGKSDIVGWDEPDPDSVIVEFASGFRALYDVNTTGNEVYTLKRLLESGSGARAYINRRGLNYQRV